MTWDWRLCRHARGVDAGEPGMQALDQELRFVEVLAKLAGAAPHGPRPLRPCRHIRQGLHPRQLGRQVPRMSTQLCAQRSSLCHVGIFSHAAYIYTTVDWRGGKCLGWLRNVS